MFLLCCFLLVLFFGLITFSLVFVIVVTLILFLFPFFSLFLFSAVRGSVQSLPFHTDISLKSFKPSRLGSGDIFTQITYCLKYMYFGMRKTRGLPLGRVERCVPNSAHKSQKLVETVQGGQDVWPGYCHLEGQLMPLHIQYVCTPNKVVINLGTAHSVSSAVRSVANFTAEQPQ